MRVAPLRAELDWPTGRVAGAKRSVPQRTADSPDTTASLHCGKAFGLIARRSATRDAGILAVIFSLFAMASSPASAGPVLWVAGNSGQILHSTGNGVWTPQVSGTSLTINEIAFINSKRGFAGGGTLRVTTNGGLTWSAGNTPPLSGGIVAMDFIDVNTGFAGGNPGNAKTYKTIDGGANWTLSLQGGFSSVNDIEFLDANRGWLAQGGSLRRTVNGGTNWATLSLSGMNVTEISFPNALDGWVVSVQSTGSNPSLAVTHDGGATLTAQLLRNQVPAPLRAVHFIDSMTGWAAGGDGTVLHTSNGGTTWDDRSIATTVDWEDVIFINALRGWVVGGTTIAGTTNGGLSWTTEYFAGASGLKSITAIVPEPSTLVLGFLGAVLLAGFGMRRGR